MIRVTTFALPETERRSCVPVRSRPQEGEPREGTQSYHPCRRGGDLPVSSVTVPGGAGGEGIAAA